MKIKRLLSGTYLCSNGNSTRGGSFEPRSFEVEDETAEIIAVQVWSRRRADVETAPIVIRLPRAEMMMLAQSIGRVLNESMAARAVRDDGFTALIGDGEEEDGEGEA